MAIDPETEQLARQMLGHAIRHEPDDLAALIRSAGDAAVTDVIGLCVLVAGYIAIDASGMRWPTEEAMTTMARQAAASQARLDAGEEEILALLSRAAFSSGKPEDILAGGGTGAAELYATASLLLSFRPEGMHWREYLDQVWNAYNAADMIAPSVLPALMFRARNPARDQRAG